MNAAVFAYSIHLDKSSAIRKLNVSAKGSPVTICGLALHVNLTEKVQLPRTLMSFLGAVTEVESLRLGAVATGVAGARATSVLREIPMAAAVIARLHAMNLATWKADPFMLETHGLHALEDLEGCG